MSRERKIQTSFKSRVKFNLKSNYTAAIGIALCAVLVNVNWSNDMEGRIAGYDWRLPITIDTAIVKTDQMLVDFPLYLEIQHENLKTEAFGGELRHSEGYDIRFSSSDGGTPLIHEVISFQPETGKLKAWVNLDTLKSTEPNSIYLYFSAFIEVKEQNMQIGERKLNGHFYSGGNKKSAKKSTIFPKDWLSLEMNNQEMASSFVIIGEAEQVKSDLPIRLQYFKSGLRGGKIMLVEWATDSELDNDYFELERSLDAKTYTPVTKMGGGRESMRTLRYSFSDKNPLTEGAYYRLKQVNFDRKFTFSNPIYTVFNQDDYGIRMQEIEPNPFTNEFTAHFSSSRPGKVTMQFFDEAGNLLKEESLTVKVGENSYIYSDETRELKKGGYVFTLMGDDRKLKVAQVFKKDDALAAGSD